MTKSSPTAGFTLIEMAVVMVIMGFVLAGAASVLSGRASNEAKRLTETRLGVVNDALTAYYIANNRLPCPADGSLNASDANFGRAQPETSGVCNIAAVTGAEAVIPWRTLGLRETESLDGWSQRLRYVVSGNLTTAGSSLPGDLEMRDGDVSNPASTQLAADAAYAVISQGENGLGAWQGTGIQKPLAGIDTDEALNINGSGTYVDRRFSSLPGDAFDDLVIWRQKTLLSQASGASFTGAVCLAANNLSTATGCPGGATGDACTISEAVLARCI